MKRISLLALAGCAALAQAADIVPENLRAPQTQWMLIETKATGVQIYECSPGKADPAKYEWAFKGPEAELFDGKGAKVGKHYGGPTWESNDGSKVMGEVVDPDVHAGKPEIDAQLGNGGGSAFLAHRAVWRRIPATPIRGGDTHDNET